MLSLLVFLPLIGGFVLWWVLRERHDTARWLTLGIACVELVLGLALWWKWGPGFFIREQAPWIPAIGIHYLLAMDGVSLVLCLLTAVVTLAAILVGWRRIRDWNTFGPLLLAAEG
ncbi:MAG: NADH-quinone oxidoreductase subunit M, partial [Chromatiaceae bacterium]